MGKVVAEKQRGKHDWLVSLERALMHKTETNTKSLRETRETASPVWRLSRISGAYIKRV